MRDLLNEHDTYTKIRKGTAIKMSQEFNRVARKILSKSEKGKTFKYLLEEDPKTPHIYGLPKLHKNGIPLRPITSGVNSAPHGLARILAKPLATKLGTISTCHLRNSGDMLNRLRDFPIQGKTLVSFDVSALFTNVSTAEAL